MFIKDQDYNYTKLRNRIFFGFIFFVLVFIAIWLAITKGFKCAPPRSFETVLMFMYYLGVHLPFSLFKSLYLPVGRYGEWFGYALPNTFGYCVIILLDLIVLYGAAVIITWEIKHMSVKGK